MLNTTGVCFGPPSVFDKKFSQLLHFADDACLLKIQNKISKINKGLRKDLKDKCKLNIINFWKNIGYTLQN